MPHLVRPRLDYGLHIPQGADAMQVLKANRTALVDYLRFTYAEHGEEFATVVLMDAYGRLIGSHKISWGNGWSWETSFRTIAGLCVTHKAYFVVAAHSHPGGDARASDEDLTVTARLREMLASIDVELLDHIVVGTSGACSVLWHTEVKRGALPLPKERTAMAWMEQ
jgi:DNA repair protein RadC